MRRLLTAVEVAEALGRPTGWVLRQAAKGELPSFKVGKAVRFNEAEIEAWLDTNRRGEVRKSGHLSVIGGSK